MLEKFENNVNNVNDNADSTNVENFVNKKNDVNVNVTESDLKYTPQSEFINNAPVYTPEDLLKMGFEKAIELFQKVQDENLDVRKDNEQFRNQNCILSYQNKKLEKRLSEVAG